MNVLDTLLAPFSLAANGVINHHLRTWAKKVFFKLLNMEHLKPLLRSL
jgi:hypothetical protein